jgi:hypothetical protein
MTKNHLDLRTKWMIKLMNALKLYLIFYTTKIALDYIEKYYYI